MENKCDLCQREFKNKLALSMHKVRAHGIRKQKRRTQMPSMKSPRMTQGIKVNFCPVCGFNIAVMDAAMQVALHMKRGAV